MVRRPALALMALLAGAVTVRAVQPDEVLKDPAREQRMFALLELRSTAPIVRKIVQAAEADRPRFRYSAPWWQSTGVQLLRVFGK